MRDNKPPAMRVRDRSYTKKSPFPIIEVFKPKIIERKGDNMANANNSLSHSKWMCKYHIVFTPKYRKKAIFNQYKDSIGKILRQLCQYKGVEIIEGHLMPDHVHMLVSIPPKVAVSSFMGYLKGKSSVLIYEKFGELKFKYRNREFWCRGYYVDTVGKNTKANAEYIRHQLDEDKMGEQLTMLGKSSDNPFTGSK